MTLPDVLNVWQEQKLEDGEAAWAQRAAPASRRRGSSLIGPLQDPAARGNARGGACRLEEAGPARRGPGSAFREFGCGRRADAGSSHPVGGARGRGHPAEPRERPRGVPSGGTVPRAQTRRAEALQRVPRAPQADQETVQSAGLPLETPAQLEDQRAGAAAAGLGGLYPGHPIFEPGCAQGTTGIPESSALAHRPQGWQLGLAAVSPACRQLPHGSLHLHPIPRASAQCGGARRAPGPLWLQCQHSRSPAGGRPSPCSNATDALTSAAFRPPARTIMCLSPQAGSPLAWTQDSPISTPLGSELSCTGI